jgi:hypothetical protein
MVLQFLATRESAVPQILQPHRRGMLPVNEAAVIYFARLLERLGILRPGQSRDDACQDEEPR